MHHHAVLQMHLWKWQGSPRIGKADQGRAKEEILNFSIKLTLNKVAYIILFGHLSLYLMSRVGSKFRKCICGGAAEEILKLVFRHLLGII